VGGERKQGKSEGGVPHYRSSKCAKALVGAAGRREGGGDVAEGLCYYGKKRSHGHKARPAQRHGWGVGAEGGRLRASSRDIV
jgi:hypothetical protein